MQPTRLAARVGLAVVAIAGFIVLSAFAANGDRFEGDLWLTEQVQKIDNGAVHWVIDKTEDVGDDPIVIGIWIGAGALFFFLGGWIPAALFGLAGAGRMLNPFLKEMIERPRPSAELVEVSETPGTFSFPSGHAATAMVLFGLIFYFSAVYIKHRAVRLVVQAWSVWMIVIVGLERVYAGEHWPSDVVGGMWFGAIIVAGIVILHRYLVTREPGTVSADDG